MHVSSLRLVAVIGTLASLTACSEGTGPNGTGRASVGFQLAKSSTASAMTSADGVVLTDAPAVTADAAGLTINRGSDAIVITKAQLVVRDVKLKTALGSCVDDDDDASAIVAADDKGRSGSSSKPDDDDDDEDCPTVHVGPFLVDMPVSGLDAGRVNVEVPEGTYSKVRLTIHKVSSDDPDDLAFRQANPDFRNISVRLEGTYNGTPFTFVSDVNAKLDVPLAEPVTIGGDVDNVTVSVDLAPWFVNPSGGLYNPALANTPGQVQAKVQNAIRSAFRAFRDRNRDGRED